MHLAIGGLGACASNFRLTAIRNVSFEDLATIDSVLHRLCVGRAHQNVDRTKNRAQK